MKWFVSGVLFACCVITPATERVQRRFDSTTGLTVSTIFSLAQDAEGFIWIGTAGGVVRYDGNQMRPWAKDIINRDVFTLSVSPAGEVIVAEGPGTLYRVTAEGVAPVPGPGGQPFNQTWTAGFDDVGRLWVVTETGELHFRDLAGVWTAMDVAGNFPGEQVRRMRTGSDSYVYILTNKAVWKLRVGERPRRILEVMRPLDVVESRDGSVFVLAWQIDGEVIQIRPDGTSISRAKIDSRPIDLAIRGDVIWALTSGHLVSLRGDEPAQISEVPSGGPLLVDHEGSLWLGSFTGLIQYPEPETTIFGARDGITNIHTRTLERTDEGIWVGTWGNINRIAREGNQWRVHDEKIQGLPCLDDRGVLLAAKMEEGIFQRRDGRFVRLSSFGRGSSYPYSCMRASDGSLLSASAGGLFRIEIDGRPPTLLSSPNSENGNPIALARVFEDGERIWAGTGDGRICHGKAAEILAGRPVSWACQ